MGDIPFQIRKEIFTQGKYQMKIRMGQIFCSDWLFQVYALQQVFYAISIGTIGLLDFFVIIIGGLRL